MKTFLGFLLLSVSAFADSLYFPPPDSAGGWRVASGREEARKLAGMDLDRLDAAYQVCERGTQNGGLLVVRHGYLVFEKYFGRAQRNSNPDMASTGKAYTSIACGIMLQEFRDRIPDGLDTKVFTEKYLPEAFPLDDPRRADITLGELLCMTAGYHGEGPAPMGVVHGVASTMKPDPLYNIKDLDNSAIHAPLWIAPGEGYSYSSPSPHIASIVLRHLTGMELEKYIYERLAKPMGWGPWGYCIHRGDLTMPHVNGAGSTAVHATDALRMAYCLLHGGKWGERQLAPASYVAMCNQPSKYNPHAPFSLMFEQNSDGHLLGVPRDAYFKSGAGGFALCIVPSLDLVVYKMGGEDKAYDPKLTDVPQPPVTDHSRDNWKPAPHAPFVESPGGEGRVLEFVCLSAFSPAQDLK